MKMLKRIVTLLIAVLIFSTVFQASDNIIVRADEEEQLSQQEIYDLIESEFMEKLPGDIYLKENGPYLSNAVYKFVDATDADNQVLLYEKEVWGGYTSISNFFEDLIFSKSKQIKIPGLYNDYFSYGLSPVYEDGKEVYYIYYFRYDENDPWIKLIEEETEESYIIYWPDGQRSRYRSVFNLDDQIVWCVQPFVATSEGVNYERLAAEENILGTIASIYGYGYKGDYSTMAALVTQMQVWSSVGYKDTVENVSFSFTDEETAKYNEITERILKAYELYSSGETLDFRVIGDNVSIDQDAIAVNEIAEVHTVELETENKDLLGFYNDAGIIYPNGVSGTVNIEKGTLTLTIDSNIYNGDEIRFCMIPPEFQRETILYKPLAIRQKLMSFGTINPHAESLSLDIAKAVDISVEKVWEDSDNRDGIRPDKITVKLFSDGVDTGKRLTLSAENDWIGSFTKLDEKKSGETIIYTVEEVSVEGYTTKVTGSQKEGFVITNAYIPEKSENPNTPVKTEKPAVPNTGIQ